MASDDPFLWSTDEVAQFFRHCIPQFLNDNGFSDLKLPGTDLFAERLHQNDINGRDLLEDVDQLALERVFGVVVFKQRLAVLRIVRALRDASIGFKSNSLHLPIVLPALPTPSTSLPHTPIDLLPGPPLSDAHPVGTTLRNNEVLYEDSTGRKRRKLNLTTTVQPPSTDAEIGIGMADPQEAQPGAAATTPSTSPRRRKAPRGYLPDKKLSLDGIFYGDTRFGQEIRTASGDDMDHEDFSIINHSDLAGQSAFVYGRVRHLLQAVSTRDITYHRKPAIAMHPYPESLVANMYMRSVTVFQAEDSDRAKAFRERDATLSYQHDEAVDVQSDLGTEWNFLLQKYKGSEKDELIKASMPDDSSSEGSFTEKQASSLSGSDDDMAEEEDQAEENVLDKDLVPAVMERMIEGQTNLWHEKKRVKLDATKAWKVWRMTKGEKPLIRGFVREARKVISQLDIRLGRLKENLRQRTWDNEADLEQACETLEPTVHDRLVQEWHILTWQRKEQPPHPASKVAAQSRRSTVVELDPQSVAAEATDDDENMREFIEDETSEDAREEITMEIESELGSVRNSLPDQSIQHDDTAESPNLPKSDAPTIDPDEENEFEAALASATKTAEMPDAFGNDDEDSNHAKTHLELESPGLPSPSTFKIRSSQPSSKKKMDVIEIFSSPNKPAERPPKFPQKSIKPEYKFSDDPDTEPIAAIPRWTYEDLEEKQDRRRLMLKIAYDMPSEIRKQLLPFLTGNMTTCVKNTIEAIGSLKKGREEHPDHPYYEGLGMRFAARLYHCWMYVDHSLFNADTERLVDPDFELPFDTDEEFHDDLRNWHANAKRAIQKIESFSKSDAAKQVIVLDDDEDDDDVGEEQPTTAPYKKRKRPVKESQPALEKRARAMERAVKADLQIHNSTVLAQMAGEDTVAIYAPDEVDKSQHVFLNPEIARRLKHHQIEGVQFMWREITAPKGEDGQGCLLAHTMGLGKTAQSIALVVTIAETAHSPEKRTVLPVDLRKKRLRVLVLCPPTLLQNWRQEIDLWCPRSLKLEEKFGDTYSLEAANASASKSKSSRLGELESWRRSGGIMLCGYNMFARFVEGKVGSKHDPFTEEEHKRVKETLLEKPHIVIADEAHYIKNATTGTSRSAHAINTERRIGLTGSPMSNNTQEIYALINWVAPGFLGSAVEFKANYNDPIVEGTFSESTKYEVRRSLQKLAALKQIIAPKMNRADISVLKGSIRSKVEFVLTVPLTKEQQIPYEKYVEIVLKDKCGEDGSAVTQVRFFGWLAILQLLCNHPETFKKKLLASPVNAATSTPDVSRSVGSPPAEDETIVPGDEPVSSYDIHDVDIKQLLSLLPPTADIEFSHKTMLVRQIMSLSIQTGDKVLLFSHSIPSLDFLETMLAGLKVKFGRIDGRTLQKNRSKVLEQMKNGKLDALLISTRAGGLGLNIQQANRVIIFDYGFNPQWEEQAVGRAYRLGQTKPVFVYRFVAGGTFEWQLYDKQIFKTGLSSRVVDKKNPIRNAAKKPSEWLYVPQPVAQGDIDSEAGRDEHVMDKIIAAHAGGQDSYIRNIKTMETMMEDAKDEALTAEELIAVQNDIALATMVRKKAASGFEGRPTLAPPPPLGAGRPSQDVQSSAVARTGGLVTGHLPMQPGH